MNSSTLFYNFATPQVAETNLTLATMITSILTLHNDSFRKHIFTSYPTQKHFFVKLTYAYLVSQMLFQPALHSPDVLINFMS